MKTFLLVDDHKVVRSGLSGLLSTIYIPCQIDEAGDANTVVEKLKQQEYDLIMMDVQVPNNDMLGLMEYIHLKYPAAKVLIFSMSSENIYAKRYLKAGAMGFLSKDSQLEEITKAVDLVLNNRKYISETLADILADGLYTGKSSNPFDNLSLREFEIVSLLLSGQTLSDISKSLHLQPSTVGTHKARAFEKLKVTNLLELKEMANSFNL